MLNTKDKAIVNNYCKEQIKAKDKIRVRLLALDLTEHYALYEIMEYIKKDLNIADEYILHSKATYLTEMHGHKRISPNDIYYANVYLHQYYVHKAFNVPMETLGKYIIHHIDMDKHNNSISNFWLFYNQQLHQSYHMALEKDKDISISKFTKDWLEDNISPENSEDLKEYLKLLLKAENDKKCLSMEGLNEAM